MSLGQNFPELKDYLDSNEEYLQILISIDGGEDIPALLNTIHYWLDSQIPLSNETELHEFYDQVSNETNYYYHTHLLKILASKKSFDIKLNQDSSTFIDCSDFENPPLEFKGLIIRDRDKIDTA